MGTEVTLLTIYDKVAAVDGKLDAHIARVDAQLDHGQQRMKDHEDRLRAAERAIPGKLGERLEALESAADQRRGGVSVLQLVMSLVLTLFGSSTAAAIVTYLLTRH